MDRRFTENPNQPSPFYNPQEIGNDGASASTSTDINWNTNVAQVPFSNNIPIQNPINVQQAAFQNLPQSPPASFAFGSLPLQPQERQNAVVQFPFGPFKGYDGLISIHRGKRKTDTEPEECIGLPRKQQITDEKMAECMSQLHINSEASSSMETESAREKRLYMCDAMRRLRQDIILPQYLLHRRENPCTAVVVWTPPPMRLLPALLGHTPNTIEPTQREHSSSDDTEQQPSTSGTSIMAPSSSNTDIMDSELDDPSNINTMDTDL